MWQQLIIKSGRELAPIIADAMSELGAVSVSLSDSKDEPVFDRLDGESPLWSQTTVTGLWAEDADIDVIVAAMENAIAPETLPPVTRTALADQDWERVWLDRFQPIKINDKLWVSPVDIVPPAPALPTVYVDPGLAFGTGTHATTHLCLDWLTKIPLRDLNAIDYGCGSGILAIAALKLGAAHAWGVDIDPRALEVSRDNASQNGVADRFEGFLADAVPAHLSAPVVLANILAEPLIELAPQLTAMVETGGRIALSGMLAEQVDLVLPHYAANFDLHSELRDGWALLSGLRR
ncbi:MAG: hypothetical protein AMJ68_06585 [Acidithiobacillales bacterium SG8_45]|jgi:ribosomal protein L11 methyltransferase|nr:MAG: hypothetical protein AMJ68_06585 [Acidithiobacillales bacterium SG8_45]